MQCVCAQCGNRWESRGTPEDSNALPKRCPNCMTTAWNRDRKKAGRRPAKPPEQPGLALGGVIEESKQLSEQEIQTLTEAPERPPTMCPHNRPVGAHCWQCKGIARASA